MAYILGGSLSPHQSQHSPSLPPILFLSLPPALSLESVPISFRSDTGGMSKTRWSVAYRLTSFRLPTLPGAERRELNFINSGRMTAIPLAGGCDDPAGERWGGARRYLTALLLVLVLFICSFHLVSLFT